ncbi:hypothetical protein PC119_g12548 [Phytophthora cactorum]|nr:hypothetical protein PC119_g12548 [Phytophthora cactorum]
MVALLGFLLLAEERRAFEKRFVCSDLRARSRLHRERLVTSIEANVHGAARARRRPQPRSAGQRWTGSFPGESSSFAWTCSIRLWKTIFRAFRATVVDICGVLQRVGCRFASRSHAPNSSRTTWIWCCAG